MSSFTYVISSRDDLSNPYMSANCNITLGGLPERTRYFRCRVLNFSINTMSLLLTYMTPGDSHYFQLVSDNFIIGGGRSGNQSLNIITTYSTDFQPRGGEVFKIANFNGKVINFKLLNEYDQLMDNIINNNGINTVWHLTLELTPIDD